MFDSCPNVTEAAAVGKRIRGHIEHTRNYGPHSQANQAPVNSNFKRDAWQALYRNGTPFCIKLLELGLHLIHYTYDGWVLAGGATCIDHAKEAAMSDARKPQNAANAMFGLGDVASGGQSQDQREKRASQSSSEPPAQNETATHYGSGQASTVSFGPQRPAAAPSSAQSAGTSGSGDPGGQPPSPPPQQPAYRQPASPQYVYVPNPPSPPKSSLKWLLVVALAVAVVALILALMQRAKFSAQLLKQSDQIRSLTHRANSGDERYAQLSAKFEVTAERLGLTQKELGRARQLAVNIEKQQQQSVRELNSAIAQKASSTQVSQLASASSQKFGQLSGSIAGTQKDLDATKEALTGAKGELSGAIARTHGELVALAHRTDRDYFEFQVRKGARQRIGSLQVQLLKTSTKHNNFTVNLFFDDKVSQRKDEAIDEPVFFYMEGAPSALELVVNKLGKNVIAGYVSAPKGFITNAANVLSARPNS